MVDGVSVVLTVLLILGLLINAHFCYICYLWWREAPKKTEEKPQVLADGLRALVRFKIGPKTTV